MATKSELIRPLSTRRAFDEVSDQIRALIYSGALTPGDKLPSEHELASQFNAGRMVIREALRGLEEAGLIVIKQGRTGGAFVNTVNAEAITRSISDLVRLGDVSRKRLTEARRGIERVVLELALRYMTPAHLAQLEANVAEAEALILAGENPLDANAAFHVLLAKATDNLLIASMV